MERESGLWACGSCLENGRGAYGSGCEGLEEFGVAFRFVQFKASDLEFGGLLRASRVTKGFTGLGFTVLLDDYFKLGV